jgi:hypothetical protein
MEDSALHLNIQMELMHISSTVDDNWNSAFPYVVGPTFYGVKTASKVTSVTEPTTVYTPIVPTLNISPQSISIPAESAVVNITVTSNTQWTVSSNQSWAIPAQSQGSGNAIIGVQCLEHTQTGNQTAVITCSASGLPSVYTTITQRDSIITLNVSTQSLTVPAYTHTDTAVNIASNGQWSIVNSNSWIHIMPMQGTGDKTLSITFDENVLKVQRTGICTVQNAKGISKTVTITQLDSVHIPSVMVADIDTVFFSAGASFHIHSISIQYHMEGHNTCIMVNNFTGFRKCHSQYCMYCKSQYRKKSSIISHSIERQRCTGYHHTCHTAGFYYPDHHLSF